MTEQITSSRVTESMLPRLAQLARSHFPNEHDACRVNYLRWLYLENPFGQATAVTVELDTAFIAMLILVPIEVCIGTSVLNAAFVVNVLTHPAHRSKRLFGKLIEHTKQSLQGSGMWLLGHPNDAAIPGWKRSQMQFQQTIELTLLNPFGTSTHQTGLREVVRAREGLVALDPSPLQEWRNSVRAPVLNVSTEYLVWRYLSCPTKKYELNILCQGKQIFGYWVRRRLRPLVHLLVDWQGEALWRRFRPKSFGITLVPRSDTGESAEWIQRHVIAIPWVKKRFRFFATALDPSGQQPHDWSAFTLAATDFG